MSVVGVYSADNVELNPANRYATMTWDNIENPGRAGSRVYYSTNTSPLTNFVALLPDVMGTNNTYTHSNLVPGLTYSYYVVAFSTNGLESAPSNVIQFRPEEANEDDPTEYTLETAVATDTNVWSSFNLISAPTNGTLTVLAPNVSYQSGPGPGTNILQDTFKYSVEEGFSTNNVTSWVSVIITPKPEPPANLVYVGTRVEWWQVGQFANRSVSNFNVKIFTNPPTPQFYSGYLIITNKSGGNITDIKVRLDWWQSLADKNTETFSLISFTNPPIQFYRNFLIITNKPF